MKTVYYLYKKWFELHKFQEVGTPINDFSSEKIVEFLKNNDFYPKDLEHDSVGNILIAYFTKVKDPNTLQNRVYAETKPKNIGDIREFYKTQEQNMH